jgi:hypothetical protein
VAKGFRGPFGLDLALTNGILFAAVGISGVFPFVTVDALGKSTSISAFEASGAHWGAGAPFWISIVAVGWVVAAIALLGFTTCFGKGFYSLELSRSELYFLAGSGFSIAAILIATWVHMSTQLLEARSSEIWRSEYKGNPFVDLIDPDASIEGSYGLFLMLAGALLIVCTNVNALTRSDRASARYSEEAFVEPGPRAPTGGQLEVLSELRDRGVLSADEFVFASRKVLANEQLRTLTELRESGVLTDEEFENASRKIYGQSH